MKYSNSVLYSNPFKPTKKPEEKKRQLPAWIETIEKQLGGGVLSSLLMCEMLELVLILGTLYYCTFMERPMTT